MKGVEKWPGRKKHHQGRRTRENYVIGGGELKKKNDTHLHIKEHQGTWQALGGGKLKERREGRELTGSVI